MADFEKFLIAEFNEQHNNMRQIETSMTQMIEVFFSIEAIILAGALSILSINVTVDQIVALMAPIFWFLFLFGHITYNIAIYSFVNILIIDFQNTVARKYFGEKYGKEEYFYFLLDPEVNTGGKRGEWEKIKGNHSAIAKFVGIANSINLASAFITTTYAIVMWANPQIGLLRVMETNLLFVIVSLVIVFVSTQKLYHRVMFLRLVRRDDQITLQRRQQLLKRISDDKLSTKSTARHQKQGKSTNKNL